MDEVRRDEMLNAMRIETIREHWWYPEGALEKKTILEVKEIYERLLDWMVA